MGKISDWVYLVSDAANFPDSYKDKKRIFGLGAVGRNSKIPAVTSAIPGQFRIEGVSLIKDDWGGYQSMVNADINGQRKYFFDVMEDSKGLFVQVNKASFDTQANYWVPAGPVALDKGDFLALACEVNQNFAWPDLPGDIANADGSVTHADGSITYPDGSVKQPDGTIEIPWTPINPSTKPKPPQTGDIINADGTITHADGTITNPDGSYVPALDVVLPNGDIKHSDGTMTLKDGRVVGKNDVLNPDRSITRENGTIEYDDGSIKNIDQSITYPGGITVPYGFKYYGNGTYLPIYGAYQTSGSFINDTVFIDGSTMQNTTTVREYDSVSNATGLIYDTGSWEVTIDSVKSSFNYGLPTYSDGYYRDKDGILYNHLSQQVPEDYIHIKKFIDFTNKYYPFEKAKFYKDLSYVLPSDPDTRYFSLDKEYAYLRKNGEARYVDSLTEKGTNITYFYYPTGSTPEIEIESGRPGATYRFVYSNSKWQIFDYAQNPVVPVDMDIKDPAFSKYRFKNTYSELLSAFGITFDASPW